MVNALLFATRVFVSHPFLFPGSSPIFLVSVMHIIQAIMYLVYEGSGWATCLLALTWGFGTIGLANGRWFICTYLLVTGTLALIGNFCRVSSGIWLIAWFLPQHFLLGIMMFGGWIAVLHGAYLDSTVPHGEWQQILVDQLGFTILFAIHSRSIFRRSSNVLETVTAALDE